MRLNSNTNFRFIFILFLTLSVSTQGFAEDSSLSKYRPTLDDKFKDLLNTATAEQGVMIFMRKCSSCHDHEKDGGHGKGPHLWNVFGRKAGSSPGFYYSEAMKNSGHSWDYASLNYYLTDTELAVPGRIMEFRGIKRDKDRARLIAFLRTLNDNPPALPE